MVGRMKTKSVGLPPPPKATRRPRPARGARVAQLFASAPPGQEVPFAAAVAIQRVVRGWLARLRCSSWAAVLLDCAVERVMDSRLQAAREHCHRLRAVDAAFAASNARAVRAERTAADRDDRRATVERRRAAAMAAHRGSVWAPRVTEELFVQEARIVNNAGADTSRAAEYDAAAARLAGAPLAAERTRKIWHDAHMTASVDRWRREGKAALLDLL